jgi:hypothetical protein
MTSNHDDEVPLFDLPPLGEYGLPPGRLDAQRLVQAVGGPRTAAVLFGVDIRSVYRWETWSYARADAMAIAAGLHPASVWPEFGEVDDGDS